MPIEIPEVVIERLPVYVRALAALEGMGRDVVSSQDLGDHLGVTPAQIRKDLSYFGRFGKQGRGYSVRRLHEELRHILGLNHTWNMILVGVGALGQALLHYGGFAPQGFRIVEAFDAAPPLIGRQIGPVVVRDVAELKNRLSIIKADIGIVAVPGAQAQGVVDTLVDAGIRSILNYAPVAVHAPRGVHIRRVDPVLELQSMTYYLKSHTMDAK